jgi:hypothetical protein
VNLGAEIAKKEEEDLTGFATYQDTPHDWGTWGGISGTGSRLLL